MRPDATTCAEFPPELPSRRIQNHPCTASCFHPCMNTLHCSRPFCGLLCRHAVFSLCIWPSVRARPLCRCAFIQSFVCKHRVKFARIMQAYLSIHVRSQAQLTSGALSALAWPTTPTFREQPPLDRPLAVRISTPSETAPLFLRTPDFARPNPLMFLGDTASIVELRPPVACSRPIVHKIGPADSSTCERSTTFAVAQLGDRCCVVGLGSSPICVACSGGLHGRPRTRNKHPLPV